jgi:hypothetical protein
MACAAIQMSLVGSGLPLRRRAVQEPAPRGAHAPQPFHVRGTTRYTRWCPAALSLPEGLIHGLARSDCLEKALFICRGPATHELIESIANDCRRRTWLDKPRTAAHEQEGGVVQRHVLASRELLEPTRQFLVEDLQRESIHRSVRNESSRDSLRFMLHEVYAVTRPTPHPSRARPAPRWGPPPHPPPEHRSPAPSGFEASCPPPSSPSSAHHRPSRLQVLRA